MKEGTEVKVEAGCCGGPAPEGADACCVKDAEAKAAGGWGCGCVVTATEPVQTATSARARGCCG